MAEPAARVSLACREFDFQRTPLNIMALEVTPAGLSVLSTCGPGLSGQQAPSHAQAVDISPVCLRCSASRCGLTFIFRVCMSPCWGLVKGGDPVQRSRAAASTGPSCQHGPLAAWRPRVIAGVLEAAWWQLSCRVVSTSLPASWPKPRSRDSQGLRAGFPVGLCHSLTTLCSQSPGREQCATPSGHRGASWLDLWFCHITVLNSRSSSAGPLPRSSSRSPRDCWIPSPSGRRPSPRGTLSAWAVLATATLVQALCLSQGLGHS